MRRIWYFSASVKLGQKLHLRRTSASPCKEDAAKPSLAPCRGVLGMLGRLGGLWELFGLCGLCGLGGPCKLGGADEIPGNLAPSWFRRTLTWLIGPGGHPAARSLRASFFAESPAITPPLKSGAAPWRLVIPLTRLPQEVKHPLAPEVQHASNCS